MFRDEGYLPLPLLRKVCVRDSFKDEEKVVGLDRYRVSLKKYPLLTGNRNEAIRYHYSPSS